MKAIVYDKKHTPFKLKLAKVEKPEPTDNQVLLKVVSVSLNASDYRAMKMGMIPKKKIFGSGVAGRIESVGKDTKNFKEGDEVVGDLADYGYGGLAEFAVGAAKAFTLKPSKTYFEDAATLPVAATTALKALRDKGKIKEGQKVLVVGSSGGVGTFAVQLAKHFGAKVTAVCSTKNIEQAKSLGAENVIDYTTTNFLKDKDRYDLILAINGSYPLLGYRKLLNSKGIYVMVGGTLGQIFKSMFFGWILSFGGKKMKILAAKSNPEDLKYVAELMDKGKIKAIIHKRYTLEQAPEAMEDVSKGHAPGKLIINV